MGFYDECRSNSYHMQKKDKNSVIRNVARYLITFWKSKFSSVETKTEDQIFTKIKEVLIPIEKKIASQKFSRARSNFDIKFIEKEKKNTAFIFDISVNKSASGRKRKSAEMESKPRRV